jgi:thiamine biosynthesis lipoprotein
MNRDSSPNPEPVLLARDAMATKFEIALHGADAAALRMAGREALDEVERIEDQLSIFRPTSEIARVNTNAAREAVRVSPPVFQLLELAQQLHRESGGAFDITIAPLVRCWGFMNGSGAWPEAGEVERVRKFAGMEHVILNKENLTVEFDRDGVMIDLGAIGKGYAIDQAAGILRDFGVTSALLHGGTSTVYAMGRPPGGEPWKIAVESPANAAPGQQWIATVPLQDEALSVSAVWGKSFEHDGQTLGHVIDPRLGRPVANAVLAAVALPSAAETDALSTALLVAGLEGHERLNHLRPGMRSMVVGGDSVNFRVESTGIVPKRRESVENVRRNS